MTIQYRYLLILLFLTVTVSQVWGQTLTGDAAPQPAQATWEILLKLAFPIVMTMVGPAITYYIQSWPPPVKYVIASLGSMLVGVGAGAIPDFPLTMESAATMGATSGAVGQALYLSRPKLESPST